MQLIDIFAKLAQQEAKAQEMSHRFYFSRWSAVGEGGLGECLGVSECVFETKPVFMFMNLTCFFFF